MVESEHGLWSDQHDWRDWAHLNKHIMAVLGTKLRSLSFRESFFSCYISTLSFTAGLVSPQSVNCSACTRVAVLYKQMGKRECISSINFSLQLKSFARPNLGPLLSHVHHSAAEKQRIPPGEDKSYDF